MIKRIKATLSQFRHSLLVRKVLRALDVFASVLIRTRIGAHLVYAILPRARPLLCSNCLNDTGLRFDAEASGITNALPCPNCGSRSGKRLTPYLIEYLIHRFFVRGSVIRFKFGGAPWLQFNSQHFKNGTYDAPAWLRSDLGLLTETAKVGVFHYGPRFWMFGEVTPLKALQEVSTRDTVIARILAEYPSVMWPQGESFFRVRVNPEHPDRESEYDSPPAKFLGSGRLDSSRVPILYCSQDIEGCIHECRVTAEDDVYVATLNATRPLKLLDLTAHIDEGKSVSEFESLDIAIHMLFFAAGHAYEISRDIAVAAQAAGFDGVLYPSYFSQTRSGKMPFETVYGISMRRLPHGADYAKWGLFPNMALFGYPLASSTVKLTCINRVILSRVKYTLSYGPVITK